MDADKKAEEVEAENDAARSRSRGKDYDSAAAGDSCCWEKMDVNTIMNGSEVSCLLTNNRCANYFPVYWYLQLRLQLYLGRPVLFSRC